MEDWLWNSPYLSELREDYMNHIMNNNKLADMKDPIILVETKGNNEEYVQLIENHDHYEVKSSWRIKGKFEDLGNAKRLYKSLVDELLAEF